MKKLFVLLFLASGLNAMSQVAINTDGSAPDNSAMLDVKSTTQGILIPRMTQFQRNGIASPANGLMVYQTDNTPGFYYNSGTSSNPVWVITGTGYGWGLNGNAGTNASNNFIGTSDNIPISLKVNNQLAGKVDHLLFNTSLGYQSLVANTTGSANTSNGYQALFSNTSGDLNSANGYKALFFNTEGIYNEAYGSFALYSNTTGSRNTASGSHALNSNTSGNNNTANGMDALYFNTIGHNNTANGFSALERNTTGGYNTALGFFALHHNIAGNNATAVGYNAMLYANNTTLPFENQNVAIGFEALRGSTTMADNTGNSNTAIGYQTLWSNTTGANNSANGTKALYSNTTGSNNTAVGSDAGGTQNTGSDCTFLGYSAEGFLGTYSNSTIIGNQATVTGSNRVRIGNSAITEIGGYEPWTDLSDARFKNNIDEDVRGLDFIMRLRPVTYNLEVNKLAIYLKEDEHTNPSGTKEYKAPDDFTQRSRNEKEQIRYSGFVAQEVESAAVESGYDFSGVSRPQNEDDLYGLKYSQFVVPLVKAVQEQQEQFEALKTENNVLKMENEELRAVNAAFEKRLILLESKISGK